MIGTKATTAMTGLVTTHFHFEPPITVGEFFLWMLYFALNWRLNKINKHKFNIWWDCKLFIQDIVHSYDYRVTAWLG